MWTAARALRRLCRQEFPARVWSYTYNEFGQVLTEIDPLNNLNTRDYYSDTTASHTKGDLQSITNALGQITRFTEYNPMGQVAQVGGRQRGQYRVPLRPSAAPDGCDRQWPQRQPL